MPHENKIEPHVAEDIVREHLGPSDPLYHQKLANADVCRRMIADAWQHGFNAGARHKPQGSAKKAVKGRK